MTLRPFLSLLLCMTAALPVAAQAKLNDPVLNRVLHDWPAAQITTQKNPGAWSYEEGTLLDGVTALWRQTGDGQLFTYLKSAVDRSVDTSGTIHMANDAPFPTAAHSMDDVEMGRSVVTLYRATRQERYYKAAKFLFDQMQAQPRTPSGGYWHKQIYPNQMWLDGAYMAEPFLADYARTFEEPAAATQQTAEVAKQLLLMHQHMADPRTGLLHHGWDESKQMPWSDKTTGLSPEVWGRAMGWYAMALVDVLDRLPNEDPQRPALTDAARQTLQAVLRVQDPKSGLWWQVMDKPTEPGNYLETSASCMFAYAIAKAVRLNILPLADGKNADRAWAAIQQRFVKPDGTLSGTVKVAGLGGKPYRSGTFDYYVHEPVGDNDAKGVGAYLLALSEMIQRQRAGSLLGQARGKTVLLDAWFNSQHRKTAAGNDVLFHYKFTDDADSGYSIFGDMFAQYGMVRAQLTHAPRPDDLKGVAIYIIVSPDNPKWNPDLHYMDEASAKIIQDWVKAGGTLMIMQNDNTHADQEHFDLLSDRFGMHFNPVLHNAELNGSYENTLVPIPAGTGGIFTEPIRALMKEICTVTLSAPAKAILTDRGETIMATAQVGKGFVYANVDPWTYNEYTDGRKNPLDEQNFLGGQQLVHWIITEATHPGHKR